MTILTQEEQYLLELVNRARMAPDAEMTLMNQQLAAAGKPAGFTLNEALAAGTISSASKQVLAPNNQLATSADKHTALLGGSKVFEDNPNSARNPHTGIGDGTPDGREAAEGYIMHYPGNSWRDENVAWAGTMGTVDINTLDTIHRTLFVDTVDGNRGHRLTLMDDNLKEVGIGEMTGTVKPFGDPNTYTAALVTEDFGVTSTNAFLTGAAYTDKDGNHFYGLGEAVASITAKVTTTAGALVGSDVTGSGGGWSVSETGGAFVVTFTGAGLAASGVAATIEGGSRNAKVDLVNGSEIDSNVNATLGTGAVNLRLLGIDNVNGSGNAGNNVITGNAGNNVLTGAGGNDSIDGGAGTDTAVFSGRQSDYQITVNGGTASLKDLRAGSPDGTDTITGIEQVTFADGSVAFTSLKTTTPPPPPPPPAAGTVTITDAFVTEGNGGTTVMSFKVLRSGGAAAFDLDFATKAGTASAANGDYAARGSTLHFGVGESAKTIEVVVNGDNDVEADETFSMVLSNATNGATIADATGIGTIRNDDVAGSIAVNDVTLAEGDSGTGTMIFKVTRTGGNAAFDVDFATKAGTASAAGGDYVARGSTLHFAAGETVKTIEVAITGDTKVEGTETFSMVLSNATKGATIADGVGIGTILDNDKSHAPGDFNGDGNSDILFHNSNGAVAMWQMNGMSTLANATVGTQATSWHAIDSFDFNGDGKADVLWQNDNGQVQLWQMDGAKSTQVTNLGSMTSAWHVGAVDDFNGNHKADVLWVNGSGQMKLELDGAPTSASQTVSTSAASGWLVKDAFDFTGDGKADILLMKGNSVAMWQMDVAQVTKTSAVGTVGDGFHFAGVADFTGDGKGDILWHNDASGQLALWQMNGSAIVANTTVGFAPAGFEVKDLGDYNHDGKADILLQNAAGAIAEWQMDGDHVPAKQTIGTVAADWHML